MNRIAMALGLAALCSTALAHDKWGNGQAVESWVKAQCCGPEDVHHIPASAISIQQDGYHIKGLTVVVPFSSALPSPDGTYWGFWRDALEPDPVIFCFFAPSNGS